MHDVERQVEAGCRICLVRFERGRCRQDTKVTVVKSAWELGLSLS